MAVVKVPKTPKSSFNPDRPPSALLRDQVKHLRWAVLPASQRRRDREEKKKHPTAKTEGQAAEHIAQLMGMLMNAKSAPVSSSDALLRAVELPKMPRVSSPAALKAKRTGTAAKKTSRAARAGSRAVRRNRRW